jgi:hypothetical protein
VNQLFVTLAQKNSFISIAKTILVNCLVKQLLLDHENDTMTITPFYVFFLFFSFHFLPSSSRRSLLSPANPSFATATSPSTPSSPRR